MSNRIVAGGNLAHQKRFAALDLLDPVCYRIIRVVLIPERHVGVQAQIDSAGHDPPVHVLDRCADAIQHHDFNAYPFAGRAWPSDVPAKFAFKDQ